MASFQQRIGSLADGYLLFGANSSKQVPTGSVASTRD
jgi:hypothetical protein